MLKTLSFILQFCENGFIALFYTLSDKDTFKNHVHTLYSSSIQKIQNLYHQTLYTSYVTCYVMTWQKYEGGKYLISVALLNLRNYLLKNSEVKI